MTASDAIRQQLQDLALRPGFAEEEALALLATFGGEAGEVRLRLDALGNDLHVEAGGEAEDGAHDGQRVSVALADRARTSGRS